MKHKLVHETINIKGWDMDIVILSIGRLVRKPNYHSKTINLIRHYIISTDMITVGTKFMCIGEVVDGVVVDVFFKYLLGKY